MASVSRLPWQCGCYEINLSRDLAVADVTGCCSQKQSLGQITDSRGSRLLLILTPTDGKDFSKDRKRRSAWTSSCSGSLTVNCFKGVFPLLIILSKIPNQTHCEVLSTSNECHEMPVKIKVQLDIQFLPSSLALLSHPPPQSLGAARHRAAPA